jgi:hypothetical protein
MQGGRGAHPASYAMGTGEALSPGLNRPERGSRPSLPTSAEVEKTSIYTSTPLYVFMA